MMRGTASPKPLAAQNGRILVIATLAMAVSGLVYELLAGTLSSYLLGDSTTQFSLVIGFFLTSMGVGSWLSRFISRHHLAWLIAIEISVGLLGGLLALSGFAAYTYTEIYQPILLAMTCLIGIFVGLEIPVVIAVLKGSNSIKINLANVLSADYVGALLASLLFPFLLMPHLGLNKSGIAAGAANIAIALVLAVVFRKQLRAHFTLLCAAGALSLTTLAGLYVASTQMISHMEDSLYQDKIIVAQDSPIQRIVVTRWREDIRLYLNGHLQFSAVDEYRYHETLVHLPMAMARSRESLLILGGGDGLALREALKHPDVREITLVDLDPKVTELFGRHPLLRALNQDSFHDPRVKLVHQDAMSFLQQNTASYDVIIADLPDPSDPALAKLYSRSFFGLAARSLRPGGYFMTQSTSPFRSREAFWCIHNTLASIEVGERKLHAKALQLLVPTFGNWGFNLASFEPIQTKGLRLPSDLRFLSEDKLEALFSFPKDIGALPTKLSTLDRPEVATYYRQGYHKYLE